MVSGHHADCNLERSEGRSMIVQSENCSGMYMGELVRQVLVDLMKDDLIFVGCDRLGRP